MPQQPLPLNKYITRPVLVIDFDSVMESARRLPAAYDLKEIEKALHRYKRADCLIGGVHNRPQVGAMEETEDRYLAEVRFTLAQFDSNPFDWVKACYYSEHIGAGPFGRRSLLDVTDIGMLVLVEAEAWSAGISVNWDDSFAVGDAALELMARKAGLEYIPIETFLTQEE